MVPLVRYTTIGGIPITELLSAEKIDAIVQRTRQGGGEIVGLLKSGSAYYAPSAAVAQMAESVLLDKKRIFPACVYLEGEFGVHGLSLGVPIKLGANGVAQIMDNMGVKVQGSDFNSNEGAAEQSLKKISLKIKKELLPDILKVIK